MENWVKTMKTFIAMLVIAFLGVLILGVIPGYVMKLAELAASMFAF